METSDAARPIYRDQIIGVLCEHDAGVKTARTVPEARDQRRDVLQLEGSATLIFWCGFI